MHETFKSATGRYKVGVDLGTAYIVIVVLDEDDNPVACEKRAASVLRDGVVVDYTGAMGVPVGDLSGVGVSRISQALDKCGCGDEGLMFCCVEFRHGGK